MKEESSSTCAVDTNGKAAPDMQTCEHSRVLLCYSNGV